MRNRLLHLIGTIVLSFLFISQAFGGGYQLNEQGARAVGMGGAFVARASDPSAIYYNPAGLALQKGFNILGGVNLILPSTKFTSETPAIGEKKTDAQLFTPINFYASYEIANNIVAGFGVFNPFGLGTKWPQMDTWNGLYNSVDANLQTWYFNPTIAFKINNQLSVGVGVSYVYGSVNILRKLGPTLANGTVELDGTAKNYNFNIGAIYKPVEGLSLGFSYRSITRLNFSGDVKYDRIPMSIPLQFFPGGTGKATLPLPSNFLFGAAYDFTPELTIEADVQFVRWSEYKNLTIDIQPIVRMPVGPGVSVQTQGLTTAVKDWTDSFILRGGAEYVLSQKMTLRGGVVLDISPQPKSKTEPMLPDGDRFDASLGAGFRVNDQLSIDAAYMIVLFMDRNAKGSATPGTYKTTAHIASINFGYTL